MLAPIIAALILVMRHGQAEHNLEKVYNSNPSHPNYTVSHLTPLGRAQALDAVSAITDLGIKPICYVSPLPRAIETADILVESGVIDSYTIDERLTELNAGPLEGQTRKKCLMPWPGESRQDLWYRTQNFIAQLPDQDVLVITHCGVARSMARGCTGKKISLPPGQIYIFDSDTDPRAN